MRTLSLPLCRGLAALCLLPAVALAQQTPAAVAAAAPAVAAPAADHACPMPPGGPDGHPMMGHAGGHFGPGMGPFGRHHAGFAHLGLDEAQQDKLFALHHEQAPQMRALLKQRSKAHRELAELGRSGQYTDAKARALADSIGKADAELALLHARLQSKVFAVLTPQQRARLTEPGCAPELRGGADGGPRHHGARRGGEGRGDGPGMPPR